MSTIDTIDTIDPWDNADHDPLPAHQDPQRHTAASLEYARADIHDLDAHDDPELRLIYALSARDNAVTVLAAADATDDERRRAEHYLAAAETFIATT